MVVNSGDIDRIQEAKIKNEREERRGGEKSGRAAEQASCLEAGCLWS